MFLKGLSPRTLFSLTPSSSRSPYCISTSSPSHFTYPHSHSHVDPRNVRVSVWWDLDNCTLPPGVNVVRGAQAITAAIESSGIKGPIQIEAFGDMLRLARTNEGALSSTAIKFTHIPHGCSADRSLFRNLMLWVPKNPPPAHLFLITVDVGSSFILHRLRMNGYNILLATKESAPGVLRSAATTMWNWDALVRGENLTGRYYKQPPIGSWYGHYEGPLEDPYTEIERAAFVPDNQPGEVLQQKHSKSKTDEVFSQESFWRDWKTFINTDLGSFIIAESSTRKKMAYYVQKYGPSVLKSLTESDILYLLDRLISENNSDSDSDDDFSDSE